MSQQQPTMVHGQKQPQPIQQSTRTSKRSPSPTKRRSPSPSKRSTSPTKRSPSPTKRSPSPTEQRRRSPSPTKKQSGGGLSSRSNITIRQNFSEESENLINQLINNIQYACYTCTSMTYYFDRQDIGLFGMANFYRWCARESYQCTRLLMDYLVVRGGEVQFQTIKKPEKNEWGTPIQALEYLLDLKKVINQQVLKVHSVACEQNDAHLSDFVETAILRPLVEFVRKVGVLIVNIERAGPKLGEYQFNKDLELYLLDLMRDVKVSHLPVTAVGAPVPHLYGSLLTPSPLYGGFGATTPNFNLTDVINLIANIPMGHKFM